MIFKVIATIPVTVLLTYPLWAPEWGMGILGEMARAPYAIAIFFGLVALYCRCLQRTLQLLDVPSAGVWWMFAIPFNFVEDFYIVRNISAALARDGRVPARMWTIVGLAWCSLQIVSLFPGIVGLLGGALAMPLWAAHWIMTVRTNRTLAGASRAASPLRSAAR